MPLNLHIKINNAPIVIIIENITNIINNKKLGVVKCFKLITIISEIENMNVIEDNNKIHISIHFDEKELQILQQQHKIHI